MKTKKCSVDNFIVAHTLFYCSILRLIYSVYLVAIVVGDFSALLSNIRRINAAPGPAR